MSYISFVGLGSGAETIAYDKGFGVGLPSLNAYVASGAIRLQGSDPGDWYEVDGGTDTIPTATDSKNGDGVIISFPTGKAALGDLGADERNRLDTFVRRWAERV